MWHFLGDYLCPQDRSEDGLHRSHFSFPGSPKWGTFGGLNEVDLFGAHPRFELWCQVLQDLLRFSVPSDKLVPRSHRSSKGFSLRPIN